MAEEVYTKRNLRIENVSSSRDERTLYNDIWWSHSMDMNGKTISLDTYYEQMRF